MPDTTPAPKKTVSDDAASDQSGDSTAATSGTAASTNQAAAATGSSPVAAVIVLNSIADATPAAANPTGTSTAIGEQSKGRAPGSLSRTAGQNNQPTATAVDAKASATADAASAQQTSASNSGPGSDTTTSGPAGAAPGAQSPGDAQRARVEASNTAFTAPQPDTSSQASADLVTARTAIGSAAAGDSSSNAQTASNTAKVAGSDLLNLGITAVAGTATTQAATATSGAATAAAIPISGLPITIATRAQAGSNQFDIRLDPPELGRIDVQLNVDSNGQVTSHVTVDRPETLTLLQSQQPQLERALEQAGLKTADNGLQFTLRDQSFAGQNGGSGSDTQQNTAQQLVIPDADLSPVDTTQIYSRFNLGGGVDIRV
jgi:flagellar hook-length control protein FliK